MFELYHVPSTETRNNKIREDIQFFVILIKKSESMKLRHYASGGNGGKIIPGFMLQEPNADDTFQLNVIKIYSAIAVDILDKTRDDCIYI